ncbi:hypothetical protein [Alteromonas flava]|uniref:hypothetical protein n=1 Tax=Alteromonas flava TaxID=2048003 RepID=UPI000C282CD9|nr:hypothetical protein [Alteromonas flava]
MRFTLLLSSMLSTLLISGCSSKQPCEDILEVQRQEATCQELARIMRDDRYPQQALTARKRYDSECVDLRYYRDGYDTICKGDQKPIGNREN